MPELSFRLRWPDETETLNYSPSTIVTHYLAPGNTYEIGDFMQRARRALHAASARVEQKYGHPCSRAQATLESIEHRASQFAERHGAMVTVMELNP